MILLVYALPIILIALVAMAVKRVPTGQVYSLYRRGRPVRLLQPGTHMVMPLLDRVAHRIDLGGRTLHVDAALSASQPVHGTVYWQVLEPERADAVIDEADQLIRRGVLDGLGEAAESATADQCDVATHLKHRLNRTLRDRGVMVTRVELKAAA